MRTRRERQYDRWEKRAAKMLRGLPIDAADEVADLFLRCPLPRYSRDRVQAQQAFLLSWATRFRTKDADAAKAVFREHLPTIP